MILTPIKAYSSPSATPEARRREPQAPHPPSLMGPESRSPNCKDGPSATGATATPSVGASGGLQPHQLSSCDGELAIAPLPEGDLPGQFTRVMGKGKTWFFHILLFFSQHHLPGPKRFPLSAG